MAPTAALSALPPGKLPPALLRELLDAADPLPAEVRVPPALGEDGCVIAVEGGALVAATDPITLTGSGVGAHAVWINANDVAVMGVRPRWFLASVLLPLGTTADEVRDLFASMRAALRGVGAVLVGGHTEVTAVVSQTVLVGQMLGLREDGRFVATGGVRPGDVVVQVGPTPIEGAAVLAAEAGASLAGVDPAIVADARSAIQSPGICVVEPALLAADLGATALHDPTEGGLATALHELADASAIALCIDPDAVLWFEPGRALCEAVGADPWGTLASGTLLAAFPEGRVRAAVDALQARGHRVAAIGTAARGRGVTTKAGAPLSSFERDELSRVL